MFALKLGLAVMLVSCSAVSFGAHLPNVCGDQTKQPAATRLTYTVKWAMASQEETFGYDVYRSDGKDGPFSRATKKPVLGAGTTNETFEYQFVDETANPCIEHWYYVEHIDTNGDRSKLTELMRAPAKLLNNGTSVPATH